MKPINDCPRLVNAAECVQVTPRENPPLKMANLEGDQEKRLRSSKGRFVIGAVPDLERNKSRALNRESIRAKEREWYKNRQWKAGRTIVARPNYTPKQRREARRESYNKWRSKNADYIKHRDLQNYHSKRKMSSAFKKQKSDYDKAYRKREWAKRKVWNDEFQARMKNNVEFRLAGRLRSRIRMALKKGYGKKAAKSMELIGCTVGELRRHIESLFTGGMSWEAFMRSEIHVDHKTPCSAFSLMNPEEQRKCFHWTNLQPLWARDNLCKGDKILFPKPE